MKFKFYEYEKCSTCIKARKWLTEKGIDYERIPIRENPPSPEELERLLRFHVGENKKLFNTSSKDYRDPLVKGALAELEDCELFDFLAQNGNLVKRPVLIAQDFVLQGFSPQAWEEQFH